MNATTLDFYSVGYMRLRDMTDSELSDELDTQRTIGDELSLVIIRTISIIRAFRTLESARKSARY